jgi:hypothetical protein
MVPSQVSCCRFSRMLGVFLRLERVDYLYPRIISFNFVFISKPVQLVSKSLSMNLSYHIYFYYKSSKVNSNLLVKSAGDTHHIQALDNVIGPCCRQGCPGVCP